MGIYVKGMVMPYGCANCHFVSKPIYDAKGRARYVCNAPVEEVCGKGNTDEVIALYKGASEAFPDWCPLVEVPTPHGDLIDRDEVRNDVFRHLSIKGEENLLPAEKSIFGNLIKAKAVVKAEDE